MYTATTPTTFFPGNQNNFQPNSIAGLKFLAESTRGVFTDGAAHFSAASLQTLSIATNSTLSPGSTSFTFAGWVYMDSAPANAMIILSKYNPTGNQREYLLYWDNATNRFNFVINTDGTGTGGKTVVANTFGAPSAATWYFIVAYWDGVNIGISVNNGAFDTTVAPAGPFLGTADFVLGGLTAQYFDGREDSLGYWKRTLTTAELAYLNNSGNGCIFADLGIAGTDGSALKTSLISWWDLNESSGTRADSIGSNNLTASTLTIISGATLNGNFETETLGTQIMSGDSQNFTGGTVGSWVAVGSAVPTVVANALQVVLDVAGTSGIALSGTTFKPASATRYRFSFTCQNTAGTPVLFTLAATTSAANFAVNSATFTPTGSVVTYTFDFTCFTADNIQIASAASNASTYSFDDFSLKTLAFANWASSFSGTSTVNNEASVVHAGSKACRLDIDAGGDSASISQTVLTVGNSYTISVFARGSSSVPTYKITTANNVIRSAIALTTSYAQTSVTFFAPQTGIVINRDSASSASIYIDDVVLTDLGPVWIQGIASGNAVNGSPVTTWTDFSGSGINAVQTTISKRPTFTTNISNSKPGLLFDGVDDILRGDALGAVFTGTNVPYTMYVVLQKVTGNTAGAMISLGRSSTSTLNLMDLIASAWRQFRRDDAASSANITGSASDTSNHLLSMSFDGTNGKLYVDSTQQSITTNLALAASTFDNFCIGARVTTGVESSWGNQYIMAVAIFNTSLSTADDLRMKAYYKALYGTP